MRVLYWTECFWPRIGGSEVAAGVLINALRDRGHDFEVVTRRWWPELPESDTWEGVPVHRIAFEDDTFIRCELHEILPLRQRVAAIKRKFGADLVHVGLTGASLFLQKFTAGQFPTPMMINLHVAPVETDYGERQPVQEALLAADWVVPVSHAMEKEILGRLPELTGRCSVIHNALPDPPSRPVPVPFTPTRLLCVGRVTEQKGFDTAIAAMPSICEAFPDAQLTIAGDGDARESLQDLARRLGVSDRVKMLGLTPPERVSDLMDAATLVLMPSRWEPFGLVALQAAQRERVCLASRIDGLPEVVQHERTGILLPPDEPRIWADAVCALLRDRNRIVTLGQQARRSASQRFDLARHVDAYESLYLRLTAGSRKKEAIA